MLSILLFLALQKFVSCEGSSTSSTSEVVAKLLLEMSKVVEAQNRRIDCLMAITDHNQNVENHMRKEPLKSTTLPFRHTNNVLKNVSIAQNASLTTESGRIPAMDAKMAETTATDSMEEKNSTSEIDIGTQSKILGKPELQTGNVRLKTTSLLSSVDDPSLKEHNHSLEPKNKTISTIPPSISRTSAVREIKQSSTSMSNKQGEKSSSGTSAPVQKSLPDRHTVYKTVSQQNQKSAANDLNAALAITKYFSVIAEPKNSIFEALKSSLQRKNPRQPVSYKGYAQNGYNRRLIASTTPIRKFGSRKNPRREEPTSQTLKKFAKITQKRRLIASTSRSFQTTTMYRQRLPKHLQQSTDKPKRSLKPGLSTTARSSSTTTPLRWVRMRNGRWMLQH